MKGEVPEMRLQTYAKYLDEERQTSQRLDTGHSITRLSLFLDLNCMCTFDIGSKCISAWRLSVVIDWR
jgi:hypothetical protein